MDQPPIDVYILAGVDNYDGINLELSHSTGDWTSKLNLIAGNSATTIDIAGRDTDIESSQLQNITWNLNREWFTLQLTYAETAATVDAYDELLDAYQIIGIPLSLSELDLLSLTEDDATFSGIGIYIDYHPWLFISESTAIQIDKAPMQNDRETWYALLGYRWNKFTCHLTYTEADSPVAAITRTLVSERIMPRLDALRNVDARVLELIEGTQLAYLTNEDVIGKGMGFRYDFHSSAAFKTEVIHRNNKEANTNATLLLMGVDMVF